MNNILTASRQNAFLECPRRHYWQYEIGLRSDSESTALFIGSAWHRAMEARWKGATIYEAIEAAWPEGAQADETVAATVGGLLRAYYEFYGVAECSGVEMQTEAKFKLALKGAKPFTVEGVIDRLGKRADQSQVLVDYKTTGDSVQPDSLYWLRLRFNIQLLQYFLAARAFGWRIDTVIYDVVRKPSIAPKMVDDLDENGLKIVLDSTGQRVFNEKGKNAGQPRQTADKEKGYVLQQHLETADEFGERLYRDCMSRPDFYFARREVPILEEDLKMFEAQRLVTAKTILHHRKLETKFERPEFAWPRHVSERVCAGCAYKNFCLQNINIDINQPPQGFAVKPFNEELNDTEEIESASTV